MRRTWSEGEALEQARTWLCGLFGPDARFHPDQWEAIEAVVVRRARVLVVQATGWGKSLVYFLATRLLREAGSGPTLVVSPLVSLMRNQRDMAAALGLRAHTIIAGDDEANAVAVGAFGEGQCDLLMVSPERLANEQFRRLMAEAHQAIGLLVVDEAHCISDWGHDFRPNYRRILRLVQRLPPGVPLVATTATANDRVVQDVAGQLGPGLEIQRGPLARASLRLHVVPLPSQAERLAWLAHQLPRLPGTGIVYALTVHDSERVAAWLRTRGLEVAAYHAKLPADARIACEERLLGNQVKALVATVALGMGLDKPDLGFVVHYQRPGSLVAYYQQIGRAGRGVDKAYAVLLHGAEDDEVQDYFIRTAFPGAEECAAVLAALEATDGLTLRALEARVNLAQTRLEKCLTLLDVEGAVRRDRGTWQRTAAPWQPDTERWARITAVRRLELSRMQAFVTSGDCLMEFIARELNDPSAAPCGRCGNCTGRDATGHLPAALVAEASRFLRRRAELIEPRRQWPSEASESLHGRIPEGLRNEPGLALSVYRDAGWGRLVADGKYHAHRFADELVAAAAEAVRAAAWPVAWVTAVPSLRHPELVAEFAARLAATLELPYQPALRKLRETAEQKLQENSARQVANLEGAFGAEAAEVAAGPVLLVDDMVDSRWTLTICGNLLRTAGSGPVYPLALAQALTGADGP